MVRRLFETAVFVSNPRISYKKGLPSALLLKLFIIKPHTTIVCMELAVWRTSVTDRLENKLLISRSVNG